VYSVTITKRLQTEKYINPILLGYLGYRINKMETQIKKHDGFKTGSGCFICPECGKRTRIVAGYGYSDSCKDCTDRAEHENLHADNDFPDDDCGEKNCPIKHYTTEQRWWRNK